MGTSRRCALLADEARSSLEAASTSPCQQALAALALPGGAVRTVQVWADGAQARLDSGVLFLARYQEGWRMTGAGCEPRPGEPYDCPVEA